MFYLFSEKNERMTDDYRSSISARPGFNRTSTHSIGSAPLGKHNI
jgi:hypothetical protein